jgi:hypothetical protein
VKALEFLWRLALSVGSALGVIALTVLTLFTFAQVVDVVPFGTAFLWANLGVAVSLLVLVLGISAAVEAGARRWGKRVAGEVFVAPVVGIIVLAGLLTQPSPPRTVPFDADAIQRPIRKPHDIVLIVDPADPAVKRLVLEARSQPNVVGPNRLDRWGLDVAFGLVALRPLSEGRPWSLKLAPTTDRRLLMRSLASLDPKEDVRATASLGRAVRDVAVHHLIGWRPRTTRTIAFYADELPTGTELDVAVGHPDAVPWEKALEAVPEVSVFNAFYPRRSSLTAIYANETAAFQPWTSWTRAARGNVGPQLDESFRFDNLAFLALNRFFFEDFQLGRKYRPHLKLDSRERFLPLDVDKYLAELKPKLCQPTQFFRDECRKVAASAFDLSGESGYLRLPGNRRGGRDLPPDDPSTPQSLYYAVTRLQGRVFVDYWWYFRFNESPVYEDFTCLAGLSVLRGSCFDHQGDWEGITVSLPEHGGTRGAAVTYAGHDWPGYRYRWATLERWGSIRGGTHPAVYVARGSHASYPAPCSDDCTQLDFRLEKVGLERPLRDGPHDGLKDWPLNDARVCAVSRCLKPLPADFAGNPVGWNAFYGEWGSTACTFVLKACMRAKGPLSPSRQPRYNEPFRGEWGDAAEVERDFSQ